MRVVLLEDVVTEVQSGFNPEVLPPSSLRTSEMFKLSDDRLGLPKRLDGLQIKFGATMEFIFSRVESNLMLVQ